MIYGLSATMDAKSRPKNIEMADVHIVRQGVFKVVTDPKIRNGFICSGSIKLLYSELFVFNQTLILV